MIGQLGPRMQYPSLLHLAERPAKKEYENMKLVTVSPSNNLLQSWVSIFLLNSPTLRSIWAVET